MNNDIPYKTAKTIKEYSIKYNGWNIVIPAGSFIDNSTACGNNDAYRFWIKWSEQIEKLTGCKNSILAHDLTYYGINIPEEYCEPYAK